jgi:hypothetical protein
MTIPIQVNLPISPGHPTRQTSGIKCRSPASPSLPLVPSFVFLCSFMNLPSLRLTTLLVTFLVLLVAIILSPSKFDSIAAASRSIAQRFYSGISINHLTSKMSSTKRTPVYFLSHGGVCPLSFENNSNVNRPNSQISCTKPITQSTLNSRKSAVKSLKK